MQYGARESLLEPRAVLRISIADMISLRVRAKESGNPPPPFLYQHLPAIAMALIATIPTGTSAVSIPQQNGRYPIYTHYQRNESGIVVVYERKPNGRYEAAEVLSRRESFEIGRFYATARRWMDKSQGGLSTIPGKYAYFAPTREEWGVILRDGGFSIIDPTVVEFSVTPELLQRRADPLTSGVLARIPIQTEISPTEASPLPVFMQVELMQDPDTTAHWISFSEFLRSRAIQSRPPGPVVPQFREWLDTLTAESDFESWKFRRGMFFGDRIEWWGNRNRRRTLHEGIDFAEGSRSDGSVRPVPAVPVRSIADGEIVSLLDDFLNKTVVVRHPGIRNEAGAMFYTFFSHIQPQTSRLGPVIRGEVLGEVHKAGSSGAPAHLHLTGAWVPECIHADEVTMDLISSTFMPLVLVNFNSLLVVSRTS